MALFIIYKKALRKAQQVVSRGTIDKGCINTSAIDTHVVLLRQPELLYHFLNFFSHCGV